LVRSEFYQRPRKLAVYRLRSEAANEIAYLERRHRTFPSMRKIGHPTRRQTHPCRERSMIKPAAPLAGHSFVAIDLQTCQPAVSTGNRNRFSEMSVLVVSPYGALRHIAGPCRHVSPVSRCNE